MAGFGLIERLVLYRAYQPIPHGDTGQYFRLAEVLSRWTLDGYDAVRTPAYPAFIALLGQDARAVWIEQMALGWAMSLLLFWLGWRTTGRPAVGAIPALLYDLVPGQVLCESDLLSETLTTFFVVLSPVLLVGLDRARSLGSSVAAGLALGTSASLAGLTRPLFFLFAAWLLPFVWSRESTDAASPGAGRSWLPSRGPMGRLVPTLGFALGPVLLLGGWRAWMHTSQGFLAPTVTGGFHLVQHTGRFFEYLPDDAAPIRGTFLAWREARRLEYGSDANTIWHAIPDLMGASGLTFNDLSRELQRLSLRLIAEHPGLYLQGVAEAWVSFWKVPIPSVLEALRPEWARAPMTALGWTGKILSVASNGAFLILGALALRRSLRLRLGVDRFALAAGGFVLPLSVVQAFLEVGDNARFLVPLQMIVILLVLRAGLFWRKPAQEAVQ